MSIEYSRYYDSNVVQSSEHHPNGEKVILQIKISSMVEIHRHDSDNDPTVTIEEIGERNYLINLSDVKLFSERMVNTLYFSCQLRLLGVPRDEHQPIIAKLYQVADEAVSPEYPIVVTIRVISKRRSLDSQTPSCAICLENFADEEDVDQPLITHMPCAHRYHQHCIVPWLAINPLCPLCRQNPN
ncbi:RING-H2 finger protein ATL66 [Rosa chinensis]|nr:RING-H2 finger protein ATL66 [Rosa chinensis]